MSTSASSIITGATTATAGYSTTTATPFEASEQDNGGDHNNGKQLSNRTPYEAAAKIQKAWRRHIDIQVYRYYRDLINFKNKGSPHLLLKCINPKEAQYLDAAAGIHVKFRLAGDRFPPNIYYKIFTHRPIQDLCANAPRDYTKASAKRKAAAAVHNKFPANSELEDSENWYQRVENNGWRLVSDRLIAHELNDPVTWATSLKKVDFLHDKLLRREDLAKRKKKRKIEWMQKMYKEGMLQAKPCDDDTRQLIDGAAAGMLATLEHEGDDAVQEWEVDELLNWTTSLNFDDYVGSWRQVGTSGTSEQSTAGFYGIPAGIPDQLFSRQKSVTVPPSSQHISTMTDEILELPPSATTKSLAAL